MLIDPFGRKIDYLRISITDRCNLRCAYCLPPNRTFQPLSRKNKMSGEEIVRIAEAAVSLGVSKIRLTGGEPLVRLDLLTIVRGISRLSGLQDLGLTTNAMLLENMAVSLAKAGLKRVNISLDTLDAEKYHRITHLGDISRVWNGIRAAEDAGLTPIKLNVVVVGGFNVDELPDFAELSKTHSWQIRFIELMPIANLHDWGKDFPPKDNRFVSVQKMKKELAGFNLVPIENDVGSGPARIFRIPGSPGTIGFIAPSRDHFCSDCNRLRLTADGHLRSCLLLDGEVDISEDLYSFEKIKMKIRQAVAQKPKGHELGRFNYPKIRRMVHIGG
jgi:cyclic pyranopterin phosphate synthase